MNENQSATIEEIKEQAAVAGAANAQDAEVVPQGEKILAAIGYFSFLCVLPLLLKPESEFCQFHGKQGLAITIVFMVFSVFMWMFSLFWGGVYSLLGLLQFLVAIYGIYFAFQGKMQSIPGFSQLAAKFDW